LFSGRAITGAAVVGTVAREGAAVTGAPAPTPLAALGGSAGREGSVVGTEDVVTTSAAGAGWRSPVDRWP
jgi:hypothetical protein